LKAMAAGTRRGSGSRDGQRGNQHQHQAQEQPGRLFGSTSVIRRPSRP
jgi:hypothetical protein